MRLRDGEQQGNYISIQDSLWFGILNWKSTSLLQITIEFLAGPKTVSLKRSTLLKCRIIKIFNTKMKFKKKLLRSVAPEKRIDLEIIVFDVQIFLIIVLMYREFR